MKKFFGKWLILSLVLVALVSNITGCSSDNKAGKENSSETITVGSKTFTEGFIVSELYALALENAGYKVDREFSLSTPVLHESILNSEIDLYPEYTGTGLMTILGEAALTDAQEVYDKVKSEYKEKFNLVWLKSSELNDSTCLVMLKETADKFNIKTLADLNSHASELTLADFEGWTEREDNLIAMNKLYGDFNFKDIVSIDSGLKYSALDNGQVDVIPGLTTESQLADSKYVVLEENIKVWPPYYLAPVIRQDVLDKNPEIEAVLDNVSEHLDNQTIISLISKVEVDGEDYEDVAAEFFNENIK